MATKATWQDFYKSTKQPNFAFGMSNTSKVSGVYDPYNNVYYGEARNKDAFLQPLKNDLSLLKNYIDGKLNLGYGGAFGGNQNTEIYDILGVPKTPLGGGYQVSGKALQDLASQKYTELSSTFDKLNTANYKFQDQMEASFRQYGQDWNNYFEASYKNPRAEAEQSQARKTQTDQYMARAEDESNRQQVFAANNSLAITPPRSVGTGISASKDTATNGLKVNGGTGLGL